MTESVNSYMDISDIPGVDSLEDEVKLDKFQLIEVKSDINKRQDDISADYSKVRQGMDFQQQMLMEAAKIALENARNGEHPKQMEVFATIMAQLTALNSKIISVHKEVAEISKPAPEPTNSTNITADNVFIGSTADLMEKFGSQQDAQDEKLVNPDE
jgi:neutral trehalase